MPTAKTPNSTASSFALPQPGSRGAKRRRFLEPLSLSEPATDETRRAAELGPSCAGSRTFRTRVGPGAVRTLSRPTTQSSHLGRWLRKRQSRFQNKRLTAPGRDLGASSEPQGNSSKGLAQRGQRLCPQVASPSCPPWLLAALWGARARARPPHDGGLLGLAGGSSHTPAKCVHL